MPKGIEAIKTLNIANDISVLKNLKALLAEWYLPYASCVTFFS